MQVRIQAILVPENVKNPEIFAFLLIFLLLQNYSFFFMTFFRKTNAVDLFIMQLTRAALSLRHFFTYMAELNNFVSIQFLLLFQFLFNRCLSKMSNNHTFCWPISKVLVLFERGEKNIKNT